MWFVFLGLANAELRVLILFVCLTSLLACFFFYLQGFTRAFKCNSHTQRGYHATDGDGNSVRMTENIEKLLITFEVYSPGAGRKSLL